MGRIFEIVGLRLRSLFRKARVEKELARELEFHLDQLTQEHIARGMSPDGARLAARRTMGGVAQVQEECREMRHISQLETLWSDLRYALRTLRRAPAFSVVIILTLALSIGANSAIFSVVEGVLLRPLPYLHPDRLVRIYFQSDAQPKFSLNPNDFRDFRARTQNFEAMAAITRNDQQLSSDSEPVRLTAFSVTAGYFRMLGVNPARGREFSSDDELPGHGDQAILSDRLWRSRFAADPAIVGRSVILNSRRIVVAGVMPPGVQHPGNNFHAVADGETVDLWMPFIFDSPNDRGSHYLDVIARLKPGVSPERANADLSAVLEQMKKEHTGLNWRVYLLPLQQEMLGRAEHLILVLLGAVGLLLLIACVNAANLLLARSSARVREIAVRTALGAGRARIVRQLLTESVMIALAAAALGSAIGVGGVRALVACLPPGFPRAAEIRLDSGVLAFTLVVAVVTGVLFGIVPALTAARTDVQKGLREGGRGTTGGRQLRIRNLLIVGETSLACVLLLGAGLMLHSFVNLLRAEPGFRPQQVVTATVILPRQRYRDNDTKIRFFRDLTAHLESLPGVQAAGAGTDLPWTGYDGNADGYRVEGRDQAFNDKTTARYHAATPDYFRALGIPLLRGRFFDARDEEKSPFVLIVNETMAKRYWPNEDALGKRITFRGMPQEKDWIRIVGIVGDIRDQPDSNAVRPAFWLPHTQNSDRSMSIVVRSTSDPASAIQQLRATVGRLDPELAVSDVRQMKQVAAESVSSQRFALFLVGLFAALALTLATIGMYGVVSYSVNQRMPEFGMRIALGATGSDLTRMIVGQSLKLAVAGACLGLVAAAALGRLLGTLLYGVSGTDPVSFCGVAAVALSTAILAGYVPARRATRADPMVALRSE